VAQRLINRIDALTASPGDFFVPLRDCATICSDLLDLGDIIGTDPILLTPEQVWAQLYGDYSAEAQQGGPIHMGMFRYQERKDFGVPMSGLPPGTDPAVNLEILYKIAELQSRQAKEREKGKEKLPEGCVTTSDSATGTTTKTCTN